MQLGGHIREIKNLFERSGTQMLSIGTEPGYCPAERRRRRYHLLKNRTDRLTFITDRIVWTPSQSKAISC